MGLVALSYRRYPMTSPLAHNNDTMPTAMASARGHRDALAAVTGTRTGNPVVASSTGAGSTPASVVELPRPARTRWPCFSRLNRRAHCHASVSSWDRFEGVGGGDGLAKVRSAVERAATLHRQATATADVAAQALESFAPDVSPGTFIAAQHALATTLTELVAAVAPGWLGQPLDDAIVATPSGTVSDTAIAIRIGTACPLPDAHFPVIVPLGGTGHIAISAPPDARIAGLLRSVVLRLVASITPGALRVRAVDPSGAVFAPFQSLFDGRLMPMPVTDADGLRAVLAEAEQWVRVPPPAGRFLLVVIAGVPAHTDSADLTRLALLLSQAASARVHFVIADQTHVDARWSSTTQVRFDGSVAIVGDPPGGSFGTGGALNTPIQLDGDPSPILINEICVRVAEQAKIAATLRVTDLLPGDTWQEDATEGLSVTVGLTGHAPLSLRLNDLTPHWLVGGRSGAGKTAWLVNILYGLCSRYSPAELTLYLLDFKEGVSFHEFTPTERDPSWMPHARAVGVESDRGYGLAVLRELDDEMTRRSVLYKDAEVTRFADLRATMALPRIVCVIDEFQVLLGGDDRTARQAVALLESLARKGRSYGIHLILASQTLRGVEALYAKRDSIFGQFPVRVALPGGSDVLDARNSVASALRLGTAVINTAGGFGGPTGASRAHERLVDFPDPHAEPKTLSTLRRRLWLARPAGTQPPYIFQGYAPARVPEQVPKSKRPVAYLGQVIDVPLTPATFAMDSTPGRHIAVIGPSELGADLLDAAARTLALAHRPGTVRFVIAPLATAADVTGSQLAEALTDAGHTCEVVDAAGLRTVAENPRVKNTYIVGFGMDGLGADLRALLREGPARRVHLIGWWRGLRRFGEDTGGAAGREDVAGVVLLNVPATDAAIFLGELDLDWQPRPNRALLHDRHACTTQVIVPFVRNRLADQAAVR